MTCEATARTTTGTLPDRTLRGDDRGAIMIIGVFMATALVGCIWYMVGLGEAMIYREQMRAAADATAFSSAVTHALGMNIIVMMNIAMAVVMSIMLALQIVFIIGIVLTVLAVIGLLADGVTAPFIPPLIDFDMTMFRTIQSVQDPVFITIAAINVTAGIEGMMMPWVATMNAKLIPGQYKPARAPDDLMQPFSLSLIPSRIPFLFNWGESKIGSLLEKKVPLLADLKKAGAPAGYNPAKITSQFSRYGLPVTDGTPEVLCQHAAVELVQEFEYLSPLGWAIQMVPGAEAGLDLFSFYFGLVIGQFPGIFCSGVDPVLAVRNQVGAGERQLQWAMAAVRFVPGVGHLMPKLREFSRLLRETRRGLDGRGKPWTTTMLPMATFGMYANGNSFGQIWATIDGDSSSTLGAITGVNVAASGKGADNKTAPGERMDYAEAEFYYECGDGAQPPLAGARWNPFIPSDSNGKWVGCKHNAMWNMFWKARLTRWQPVELPVVQALLGAVYTVSGADAFVGWVAKRFPFGSTVVGRNGADAVKSCYTNIGRGVDPGSARLGQCPFSMGGEKGDGVLHLNTTAPDGRPMSEVFH
jgi:hypothetical protein